MNMGGADCASKRGRPAVLLAMTRFRLAIVVSRYNRTITDALLAGAKATIRARLGGGTSDPAVLHASGSFEILAISRAAAVSGRFDGIVALGCIIKGETSHDLHLASAVTSGLAHLTLHTGVPVGLGVLTVDTIDQARARAGLAPEGASLSSGSSSRVKMGEQISNKGAEAADALIDTLVTMQSMAGAGAVVALGTGGSRRRASKRSAGGAGVPSPVLRRGDVVRPARQEGTASTIARDRRSPVPDKAASVTTRKSARR